MKTLVLALIALSACRQEPRLTVLNIQMRSDLSPTQQAECPKLDQFVSMINARLIIEGMESTPCPLTVTASAGLLSVAGSCPNVATGQTRTLTLEWYAVSHIGKEITLAQSIGRADLTQPDEQIVDIVFDPTQAALKPKTSAMSTETTETRDLYNCDRTGTNVCDSTMAAPSTTTPDQDTCSNLQEMCQETLFNADGTAILSIDQCPPGPRVPS